MSSSKRPAARRKSHFAQNPKWEHPPPTPLHDPNESCFPKNRTHECYMKYHDYKTEVTKYYFVLSNNFLLAAKSVDSKKLSIVIPVEGKTIVIDESDGGSDSSSGSEGGSTNDGCRFIIGGKKKTFHFETPSRRATLKWMDVIRKACCLKVTDVYRLAYEIGSGSCGTTVIAAEHRSTRKRVAIKVINKKKIKNKQRLSHEITIMKVDSIIYSVPIEYGECIPFCVFSPETQASAVHRGAVRHLRVEEAFVSRDGAL